MNATNELHINQELTVDDIRQQWIKTLADQDTRYHLTITFPANTNQKETRKLLNLLLRHLNRKIFNRQYEKGIKFLRGFAIEEFTHKMSAHHYHILIANDEFLPDHSSFHQMIHMQVLIFNGQHLRIDRSPSTLLAKEYRASQLHDGSFKDMVLRQTRELTPRKMTNCIETWLLQDYSNDGGNKLEQYVTKNFEKPSFNIHDAGASIGLLSDSDVVFG
jgi:hypothetical protein